VVESLGDVLLRERAFPSIGGRDTAASTTVVMEG
jgi:hypothetical protein